MSSPSIIIARAMAVMIVATAAIIIENQHFILASSPANSNVSNELIKRNHRDTTIITDLSKSQSPPDIIDDADDNESERILTLIQRTLRLLNARRRSNGTAARQQAHNLNGSTKQPQQRLQLSSLDNNNNNNNDLIIDNNLTTTTTKNKMKKKLLISVDNLSLSSRDGDNDDDADAEIDIQQFYSKEIVRLAMEFNSQQALTPQELFFIAMYGIVVIVSLFGNLLVCKVILGKRSMRSRTTNIFIANLTISDLLMTVFTIPMFIVRNIMNNWPFGAALCKLLPLVQALSVYVSVLSMVMIAVDRYQALIRPLKVRVSHRVRRPILIAGIWSASLVLAIPNSCFNTVAQIRMLNTIVPQFIGIGGPDDTDPDNKNNNNNNNSTDYSSGENFPNYGYYNETNTMDILYRCKTVYPLGYEQFVQRALTCVAFATQFVIPLLIVVACYTIIGVKISKRTCIGEPTVGQAKSHLFAKRKTIKMLIIVVVVFAACWLPYNLLYIFKDFYDINFSLTMHYITHWLAMSSICFNPFIYFWLNRNYRQGMRWLFRCCHCCNGEPGSASTRAVSIQPNASGRAAGNMSEPNQSTLVRTTLSVASRNRRRKTNFVSTKIANATQKTIIIAITVIIIIIIIITIIVLRSITASAETMAKIIIK